MEKQKETPKTRMEKVCGMLGLEMHQEFNVSDRCGGHGHESAYAAGSPYFFTQCGIVDESGRPCSDMLMPLIKGSLDVEPLPEYRYYCTGTVEAGKMAVRKVKTVAASLEVADASKALCGARTGRERRAPAHARLTEQPLMRMAAPRQARPSSRGCCPLRDHEKGKVISLQRHPVRDVQAHRNGRKVRADGGMYDARK